VNPKQFLQIGGVVLLLVGILGFIGVIGPTPDKSLFGEAWYFDNPENWAHTILGIVALIAAFSLPAASQKMLTMLVGLLAIFFGVYNIFSTNFLGANLESPTDMILHFAIGIWALYASMAKSSPTPV
jgi:uncharacterized membrane protein HdeD (DUF308 family)